MTANKEPLRDVAARVAQTMPQTKRCLSCHGRGDHSRGTCAYVWCKRGTTPINAVDLMVDKHSDGWGNRWVRALFSAQPFAAVSSMNASGWKAWVGDGATAYGVPTPHEAMLRALGALVASREDEDV